MTARFLKHTVSHSRNAAPHRGSRLLRCIAGFTLLVLGGCGSWLPEMTPYGAVAPPDHNRSLNGLGVVRKLFERGGAKCITPQKLSPKLESVEVIVLVGQSYAPPGKTARDWLENWLAQSTGRTLIYFGRDFNAEIYYRQQTLSELPPEDRTRGEQLLALAEASEFSQQLQELPESTFCRWFYLQTDVPLRTLTDFSGAWARDLPDDSNGWPVGVTLRPPKERNWQADKPSWLTAPANNLAPANTTNAEVENDDALVQQSIWTPDELDSDESWNREFRDLADSEVLLAGADGTPLVFKLTSDRFPGSQIFIATNGAPLLNGSLVEPMFQSIGERIVQRALPAKRVALLAYSRAGILIADTPEADRRGAGLEMLVTWPLSAVTMPAALLGIIICASLLPILGRPQKLQRRSVSDFGLHVEAIGRMMVEAGDLAHAKRTIVDYFQRVKGEKPPTWVQEIDVAASVTHQPQQPQPTAAQPTQPQSTQPPAGQSPTSESPASESPATQSPAARSPAAGSTMRDSSPPRDTSAEQPLTLEVLPASEPPITPDKPRDSLPPASRFDD